MATVFVGIADIASQYIAIPSKLRHHMYLDVDAGTSEDAVFAAGAVASRYWVIKPIDSDVRVSFTDTADATTGWPVLSGETFIVEICDNDVPSIFAVA